MESPLNHCAITAGITMRTRPVRGNTVIEHRKCIGSIPRLFSKNPAENRISSHVPRIPARAPHPRYGPLTDRITAALCERPFTHCIVAVQRTCLGDRKGSEVPIQSPTWERQLSVQLGSPRDYGERLSCRNYGRSRHAICTTEFGQFLPFTGNQRTASSTVTGRSSSTYPSTVTKRHVVVNMD